MVIPGKSRYLASQVEEWVLLFCFCPRWPAVCTKTLSYRVERQWLCQHCLKKMKLNYEQSKVSYHIPLIGNIKGAVLWGNPDLSKLFGSWTSNEPNNHLQEGIRLFLVFQLWSECSWINLVSFTAVVRAVDAKPPSLIMVTICLVKKRKILFWISKSNLLGFFFKEVHPLCSVCVVVKVSCFVTLDSSFLSFFSVFIDLFPGALLKLWDAKWLHWKHVRKINHFKTFHPLN